MTYQVQTKPKIKIYRDGKLARWETLKPLIHDNMVTLGRYIDRSFTSGTFKPGQH